MLLRSAAGGRRQRRRWYAHAGLTATTSSRMLAEGTTQLACILACSSRRRCSAADCSAFAASCLASCSCWMKQRWRQPSRCREKASRLAG